MSNYTKPQDPNHEDTPQDWLNSAIIFTRALSLILKENEGIVVKVVGDAVMEDKTIDKVVVYYMNKQVHILPCDKTKNMDEGQMVWMSPLSSN